jgi:NADH:ubiquinone oxidoreductase subunit 2 (subunit N)
MSSATKVAALFVTYRVLATAFPHDQSLWRYAIAVIACISLAWGNIAALVQRNVKRILAYSSVSHAGFMLIAVAAASQLGARALAFYVVPYAAMSLGSFAIVAARERELGVPVTLENLAGFGWERPFLGVAMWVFMLGFLGFPLTGGFIGKFYVFAAAYDSGMWWLIVAGVIATMISAYYYLGVVRAMYFRDAAELQLAPAGGSPPRELVLGAAVAICLVVTVGSFFAVQRRHERRPRAADLSRGRGYGLAVRGTVSRRRTGTAATESLIAKTPRHATRADQPSGGIVPAWVAGERAAHESTRSPRASVQSSACRPPTVFSRSSR